MVEGFKVETHLHEACMYIENFNNKSLYNKGQLELVIRRKESSKKIATQHT